MKRLLVSVLVVGLCLSSQAQKKSTKEELNAAGDLQAQYDYLWESSGKYQANKVIKMSILNQFNSNVQDSVEAAYELVSKTNSGFSNKVNEVKSVELTRDSLASVLKIAKDEKDSFEFLGTKTSKSSFRALFFIITGALLVFTLISFFRMRSKSGQASEDKSRFETLELEFEDFKKRSREKEQVLARQLQDEINKNL